MKISKSIIIGLILWVFAMGSIMLVPVVKARVVHRETTEAKERMDKHKAAFFGLSLEDQEAVVKASKGLMVLNDGEFHLIGESCGIDSLKELVCMKIRYVIKPADVEELIIRHETKSVEAQLPPIEQLLLAHNKAVLIRDEDKQYLLIANRDAVIEYREKYKDKTGCKTCDKK